MARRTVGSVGVVAARDLWLAELATNGASRFTIRNYTSATDEAFAVFAARRGDGVDPSTVPVADVDRDDVVAALAHYAQHRGRSGRAVRRAQSTVASMATALRSYLSWCVETGKAATNPMATVKRPKSPVRVPKAMGADQCRALLAAADVSRRPERDRLMLLLGLTMGLRLAEIAGVRPGDLFPSAAAPTHLRVVGKGNKERLVPVPSVVAAAVAAWLPVRQELLARRGVGAATLLVSQRVNGDGTLDASRETVGQTYTRLLAAAGLTQKGRRVHVARHSFATLVLESGADILTVSELLGHASIATTHVYVKANPERMMAAVENNPLAGR